MASIAWLPAWFPVPVLVLVPVPGLADVAATGAWSAVDPPPFSRYPPTPATSAVAANAAGSTHRRRGCALSGRLASQLRPRRRGATVFCHFRLCRAGIEDTGSLVTQTPWQVDVAFATK